MVNALVVTRAGVVWIVIVVALSQRVAIRLGLGVAAPWLSRLAIWLSDNVVISDGYLRQRLSDTIVIIMIPEQSKMARAALGWSLTDLASKAGVGRATAARLELGETVSVETVAKIRAAVEAAGLTLLDSGERSKGGGAGIRLGRD